MRCKSVKKNKIHVVPGVKSSTKRKMASAQLQMGVQHLQRENAVPEAELLDGINVQPLEVNIKTPGKVVPKTPAKNLPKTPGKIIVKTPGKKTEVPKKGEEATKKRKASVPELAAGKRKDKVEVEMKG